MNKKKPIVMKKIVYPRNFHNLTSATSLSITVTRLIGFENMKISFLV